MNEEDLKSEFAEYTDAYLERERDRLYKLQSDALKSLGAVDAELMRRSAGRGACLAIDVAREFRASRPA